MKLLALDCSNQQGSVALYNQGELTSIDCEKTQRHAEVMLPLIEKILIDSDIALSQLDGIACCRGPGSFTGVRITSSIAKGLAHARGLPIRLVSSLAAIAEQVMVEYDQNQVLSLIDARMNEVYWSCYQKNDLMNPAIPEQVSALKHVADFAKQAGASLVVAELGLSEETPFKQLSIPIYPAQVHAESIARLALHAADTKAIDALPTYVRDNVIQ